MTKHAKLGASGAHRWRNCAGSNNLSEGLPDITSSYAEEGTRAHEIAEHCLKIGAVPNLDLDPEMRDAIQVYLKYVWDRVGDDGVLFVEKQFDLAPLSPPDDMFGITDATIWTESERHLEVIDFKYGAGVVVDAVDNDQGFIYSLGGVIEVGEKPDKITVTIVQPRAHHEDGIIRSWTFDWDFLVEEKKALFADAAATLEPDAPLKTGDWCRFCKAKAICPAQRAQVEALAVEAFAAEPTFPVPAGLSLTDLAEVLDKAPAVMDWIKSVQGYALNRLQRGENVPGFKLVEKKTNRRWVDEDSTLKYLAQRKLKIGERTNRKVISPAQAEKILKDKPGPELPDRLWVKPEGGAALAPLSDKRPEKVPGVFETFGAIAETMEE